MSLGPCPSNLARDDFQDGHRDRLEPETRAHIDQCPICQQYLEARSEVLGELPPDFALERPASGDRRRWGVAGAAALSAGAVAAGLVVVLDREPEPFGLRTKGSELRLEVRVGSAEGPRRWSGEPLHPGDLVEIRLPGSAGRFGLVYGREATGARFAYAPADGVAKRVSADGVLGPPVRLDGSLGREEIVAVVCDVPVGLERVDDLPEGCATTRLDLLKTIRPAE